MPDTTVRYFDSAMTGAPTLDYHAGYLVNTLDACLVNGFGSVTLNSLVVSDNVATGTVSAGHNFAMIGTNVLIGPVIRIEGATPSGLNGDWRLAAVPNSTTFTFYTSGISDQTATGTITAKRAPAGWSKAFSGTNKAAYLQGGVPGRYLRIAHTADADSVTSTSYPTMTDVDTGSGLLLSNNFIVNHSARTKVPAAWKLVADHRLFWITIYFYYYSPYASNPTYSYGEFWKITGAGDLLDLYAGGSTYAMISPVDATTNPLYAEFTKVNGTLGTAVAKYFSFNNSGQWGDNSFATYPAYPAPINNGIIAMPVYFLESNEPRLQLPGIYAAWQREMDVPAGSYSVIDYNEVSAVAMTRVLQKIRFYQNAAYFGMAFFDLNGPWR